MDDERSNRIEQKLDKVVEHISSIDVTLGKQSIVLEEHTRRSLANEKAVATLKEELKPVVTHVTIMNFIGKLALVVLGSDIAWELVKRIFRLE